MALSQPTAEQKPHFGLVLLSLLTAIMVVGAGIAAFYSPARAAGSAYTATVSGPTASVPTNSTAPFTVSVNCRFESGCDGASLTFQRPVTADGTRLSGPMVISLASGANPAITYTVDNVNSDNPKLTFTRFDNQISQIFQVSWQTKDPQVIPGTYSMEWRTDFPKGSYSLAGQRAQVTVSGSMVPQVVKSANSSGNVFNGALRTFTLNWSRPSRQSGNSGLTTVLVDQLPANYVFKGFSDAGVGADMRFRRLDGTNAVLTTESGQAIYEYLPDKHQVVVRITRGVDAYIADRNAGRARISYDVQVNGMAGGSELAEGTKLTNTVTATDVKTLSGAPVASVSSAVTLNYTRNRPGTFTKSRGISEYMTTTSDDPGAPDIERPFTIALSNPGTAPTSARIVDNTQWQRPLGSAGEDYRYLTKVSLDPVQFNDGRVETYGATVVGTTAAGERIIYTVVPNQVLTIPVTDKIVSAELTVNNLSPMDNLPQTADNGVLRLNLGYNVRITTPQITGDNPTETSPQAIMWTNTAQLFLGGKSQGTARSYYTFYGKLPLLVPHISVRGINAGSNFNLVRNQPFTATVGLYAAESSGIANPEAFMILPRGFTLGQAPKFTDTGVSGCKPADAWQFEKMADYNGSQRWRITLKDPNDRLNPGEGSNIYCYNLTISSGSAQAGTYDKAALTDQMHNLGLWIREKGGALSHSSMSTADSFDVNSDGDVGGRWASTSLNASVASTTSIGVSKAVTGDVTDGAHFWESGTNEDFAYARKQLNFTVTASTTGTSPVKDMVIYDMLPNANNTGDNWVQLVSGATTDYSEDTTFSPDLAGPVTAVDHTKSFTAYYTTVANPCRPELSLTGTNFPDSSCPTFNAKNEWTTDLSSLNLADVTAVRIVFNEAVFGDFSFTIPMTMPKTDMAGNPLDVNDVATNRAGVGGRTNADNKVIPYVGPAYAKVKPQGAVGIEKSAIIAGQPAQQTNVQEASLLRRGDRFIYVVKATADPQGAGLVDPVVFEQLPNGISYVSTDPRTQGEYSLDSGEWKPGPLVSGESKYLYLEVEVTGAGNISNFAQYVDPQNPSDSPNLDTCAPHSSTAGDTPCDSFTIRVDAGDASISGNVFNDLDWSNTRNDGDQPRAGVTVQLFEVLTNGTLAPINTNVTDADGNYTFGLLPEGRYEVRFLTEDGVRYAAANVGGDEAADSDATTMADGYLTTGPFNLGETEQKKDVDLGVQPLSVIQGMAFNDLNNNGVRDTGEAIMEGITAVLLNEDGSPASVGYAASIDSAATGTNTAVTTADGTYTFEGVRPGTYKVRFTTPESFTVAAPSAAETITVPDVNDAVVSVDKNDKLVVTTSETRDFTTPAGTVTATVDAGFTPLGSAEGIFWTDNNGDGHRDADEAPRQGVTIILYRVLDDGTRQEVDRATTDDNGAYGWFNLPPGNYAPQVELPAGTAFGPLVDGNPATDAGNDYDATGLNTGTLPPGGVALKHLDGAIVPLSVISGIAFWDDNADGEQQDKEPQLPEGQTATIELYRVGTDIPVATMQATAGEYRFDGVAPGEYYVKVTNLSEGFFSTVKDPTSDITAEGFNDFAQATASGQTRTFIVSGGADYPNIDGGIVRQQRVTGSAWNDTNNDGIRQDGEQPRAGVTVTLTDALGHKQTTVTDAEGNYQFQGVAIGGATITFTQPDGTVFSPTGVDSDVDEAGSVTVTVEGSKNLTGVDAGIVPLASVSGRVVVDSNRDGTLAADEPGLEGLEVSLLNAQGEVVATTTTDANGAYVFNSVVPAAGYVVQFATPDQGVFTGEPAEDIAEEYLNDADPATGRTQVFTVTGGQDVANVDAGIINFASISGIAFNDNGDGGSEGNDGIRSGEETVRPGLPVSLVNANGDVVAVTTTGEDGTYHFEGVAPGTYRIFIDDALLPSVEISRIASTDPSDSGHNNIDPNSGYSHEFTVAANQDVTNVDIGVVPHAGIAGNVFNDYNRNGVRDEGEPGISNVTVNVYAADDTTRQDPVDTTTTTELGTWFVDGVGFNQDYVVEFVAPDGFTYSMAEEKAAEVSDPLISDVDGQGLTPEFRLPAGQYPNVDAGLIEGANLSGIAFNDPNNDGTKQNEEALLPGITVTLWKQDVNGEFRQVAETITNQDGYYEFLRQTEGTYQVRFTAPVGTQFTEQQSSDLTVPGLSVVNSDGQTNNVTVKAGDNVVNLDAGILDLVSISGVAFTDVNRDGLRTDVDTPRSGVKVTLTGKNSRNQDVRLEATTNEAGEYTFTGLLPGTYQITFGTQDKAVFTKANQGENNTIDSDADPGTGKTKEFSLEAGKPISGVDAGYVVDANIAGSVWIDTNNDGKRDADEMPYTGLEVQIFLHESGDATPGEGNWVTQTTTDETGRYEILDVPAGTYMVRFVTPDGYVFSPKSGTVISDPGLSDVNPSGENVGFTDEFTVTPDVDITTIDAGVVPTTSISGMAFVDSDRDGHRVDEAPREGIEVTLKDKDGNTIATTTTAADGSYTFTDVRPGDYSVTFSLPTGEVFSPFVAPGANTDGSDSKVNAQGAVGVTVTAGVPVVGIDAGYLTTATISGLAFLDYNGDGINQQSTPAAGVSVQLYDANGNPVGEPRSVDADGRYSFDVAPGRYSVQFFNDQGLAVSAYPPREGGITEPGFNDAGQNGRTALFSVAAGRTYPNIDAGFAALGSLSGTVFDDQDEDSLRGTDPGVGGVTVALMKPNGDSVRDAAGNPITTTTDQFGDYSFTNVPNGTYVVKFTEPSSYTFIAGDNGQREVNLDITRDNNAVTDVDLGLRQIPTPVTTTQVTSTATPTDGEATPTATTTLPAVTPTVTPTDGTITVTETVVVPPTETSSEPVPEIPTETVTVTATETSPPATETITITPTVEPTPTDPDETPTVTVTVVVPPTTELAPEPTIVTETVTTTAQPTEPVPTETITITPTVDPTPTEPGETPTVTVTVVVPPTTEPEPTVVTETVTVTEHPETPSVTPTATETLEPTATPTPTDPTDTPTVTVTVVVPPTTEPAPEPTIVTETVTTTAQPTEPVPTETITITATVEPTPTDPGETPTVTVTVVVPPTTSEAPSEPAPTTAVTETVTVTEHPETPGVTPTQTATITPTEVPTPTDPSDTPTITVTVVVPPTTNEVPSEPVPTSVVTETVTVTEHPETPGVTPTQTATITPTEVPTPTDPSDTPTVTVTVVVPPTTTEPAPTTAATTTVTVTEHPDTPGVTPTATQTLEPTVTPTPTDPADTPTVTVTVVVPPSTEATTTKETTEPTPTSGITTTTGVTTPRPTTTTPAVTTPPSTNVQPTTAITGGAGSGGTAQPGIPTTTNRAPSQSEPTTPRSGGLASTGANVIGLLIIAVLMILGGAFLIRRKKDNS